MKKENKDGYGIVIIDKEGNKALTKELRAFGFQLQDYIGQGDHDDFFADCVLEYVDEDVKDCMVVATYQYKSIECRGFDYVDYEDDFVIQHIEVLRWDYKEFWRDQLSDGLTVDGHRFGTVDELLNWKNQIETDGEETEHYMTEDVEEWELFYDEELILSERYRSEEKYKSYNSSLFLKGVGFNIG